MKNRSMVFADKSNTECPINLFHINLFQSWFNFTVHDKCVLLLCVESKVVKSIGTSILFWVHVFNPIRFECIINGDRINLHKTAAACSASYYIQRWLQVWRLTGVDWSLGVTAHWANVTLRQVIKIIWICRVMDVQHWHSTELYTQLYKLFRFYNELQ